MLHISAPDITTAQTLVHVDVSAIAKAPICRTNRNDADATQTMTQMTQPAKDPYPLAKMVE